MDILSENCIYKQIRELLLNDIFSDEIEEYKDKISVLECDIQDKEDTIQSLFSTIRRKNKILSNVINKNNKSKK